MLKVGEMVPCDAGCARVIGFYIDEPIRAVVSLDDGAPILVDAGALEQGHLAVRAA